jgi:NodT family efflux transporter outer membrane factor (OMF) lipoprotein
MSRFSSKGFQGQKRDWFRSAAVIVLAGAISGCAVIPPSPRAVATPASATNYATKTSFTAPESAWPSDQWWLAYKDPQLTALINEGLASAPDMRIAAARFARAKAVAGQAASLEQPSLSANGEAGVIKQSYNYIFPEAFAPRGWKNFAQTTLDLSWDLDFWGKNRAAAAAAHKEAAAAAAEAAATRLVLSTGIASAYADLAQLYAERDATKDAVEVRRRTAELIRGRFVNGLENDGAVERAQSGLATAEADLAALLESIDLKRTEIAALMGAGPDRGLAIQRPAPLEVRAFGLPADLPLALVGRRPDVIAAKRRAEAASSRIKSAKAAFYPDINLSASVGLQALGVANLTKAGSDFGNAAPAVDLPIFDGGRLRAQYRSAEADYQIAVAQYDAALTQALREVADAATSERALTTRLDRTRSAEQSALAAWRIANNRYKGGLATYLDVLTAEDALIASRRAVASLETRAFALDVSLTRALGGGFRS